MTAKNFNALSLEKKKLILFKEFPELEHNWQTKPGTAHGLDWTYYRFQFDREGKLLFATAYGFDEQPPVIRWDR